MRISDVLRAKGGDVRTIPADGLVRELLARLADFDIGALLVVDGDPTAGGPDGALVGIVSERDVVRQLNRRGDGLLDAQVNEIMTREVVTCSPADTVDAVAETMTERRIRHMPVIADGVLQGVVSIGDVVKSRIAQLESDRGQLEHYITG